MKGVTSISDLSNADLVEAILALCFPRDVTVCDVTYGNGMFWRGSKREVIGCDLDKDRAKDFQCDFTKLPFADGSFDVVVFDPPFQPKTNVLPGNIVEKRFTKISGGIKGVKPVVVMGLKEAWRVSQIGVLYKCQDYIYARRPVWMTQWGFEVLGDPYEIVYRHAPNKLISSKWRNQQSAWRTHTTFMAWTRKNLRVSKAA